MRKLERLCLANRDLKSEVVDDVTKLSGRDFQIGTILTTKTCLRTLFLARGTARRRECPRKFVLLGKLIKSEKVSVEKTMDNIRSCRDPHERKDKT